MTSVVLGVRIVSSPDSAIRNHKTHEASLLLAYSRVSMIQMHSCSTLLRHYASRDCTVDASTCTTQGSMTGSDRVSGGGASELRDAGACITGGKKIRCGWRAVKCTTCKAINHSHAIRKDAVTLSRQQQSTPCTQCKLLKPWSPGTATHCTCSPHSHPMALLHPP